MAERIRVVNSPPPFVKDMLWQSGVVEGDGMGVDWKARVEKIAKEFEPAYVAFQTVRWHPVEGRLTGWEPKCVHVGYDPEKIAGALAGLAASQIKTMKALSRQGWNKAADALSLEKYSPRGVRELDAMVGAINAKLNMWLLLEPRAVQFRDKTYSKMGLQNHIEYKVEEGENGVIFHQWYSIPKIKDELGVLQTLPFHGEATKPYQDLDPENPFHFMLMIGWLGHPLVRALIRLTPDEVMRNY